MVPVFVDRPRFNGLPLPTVGVAVAGALIVSYNPRRVGLLLYNNGTANVYISAKQYMTAFSTIIPPGAALQWSPGGQYPTAPVNSIFALGDAGHDLRVSETVLMSVDTSQPGA